MPLTSKTIRRTMSIKENVTGLEILAKCNELHEIIEAKCEKITTLFLYIHLRLDEKCYGKSTVQLKESYPELKNELEQIELMISDMTPLDELSKVWKNQLINRFYHSRM